MKILLQDLATRLTSRKLWLTVGTFTIFVANHQYNEALAVALAYLGIQGITDYKQS